MEEVGKLARRVVGELNKARAHDAGEVRQDGCRADLLYVDLQHAQGAPSPTKPDKLAVVSAPVEPRGPTWAKGAQGEAVGATMWETQLIANRIEDAPQRCPSAVKHEELRREVHDEGFRESDDGGRGRRSSCRTGGPPVDASWGAR